MPFSSCWLSTHCKNFWFLFCFSLQVRVANVFFQRSSSSLWKQPSLLFRHRLCCWWKHVTWRDWLIDSNVKTNAHHVTDKSHADCPGMSLCDRSSCAANDSRWFAVLISCLRFEGCFPPVSNNTGKQDGKMFWVYQYTDWMNNQKSLAIYPFNILRKVSAS